MGWEQHGIVSGLDRGLFTQLIGTITERKLQLPNKQQDTRAIRLASDRQRGYALISAMVLLLMMTLLGSALVTLSVTSDRMSIMRRDSEAAFNLAEAGFNHAYSMLQANSNYTGALGTPLGTGSFDLSVVPVFGQPTKRRVTATGTVKSFGGYNVVQSVSGVIDTAAPPIMGSYAILAKGTISSGSTITTNSAPTGAAGNIFSNTSISLTGGSTINGSAGAAGAITGGTVTGGNTSGASPVTFPSLDVSGLLAQAQALGTTNGNITVGAGSVTVTGYVSGNLNTSGAGSILISGIVYVHGNVVLSGSSYGGNGILVSDGKITLSEGDGFTGAETNSLAIVGLSAASDAMKLMGGPTVRGALYVPNGTTVVSGGSKIYGSVASNAVTMTGPSTITRDTNFAWPTQLGTLKVNYWCEVIAG